MNAYASYDKTSRVFELLLSHFEAERGGKKKVSAGVPRKGRGKAELLQSQLKLPLRTASSSERRQVCFVTLLAHSANFTSCRADPQLHTDRFVKKSHNECRRKLMYARYDSFFIFMTNPLLARG